MDRRIGKPCTNGHDSEISTAAEIIYMDWSESWPLVQGFPIRRSMCLSARGGRESTSHAGNHPGVRLSFSVPRSRRAPSTRCRKPKSYTWTGLSRGRWCKVFRSVDPCASPRVRGGKGPRPWWRERIDKSCREPPRRTFVFFSPAFPPSTFHQENTEPSTRLLDRVVSAARVLPSGDVLV
jgi:hypothetical protein